MTTEAKTKTKIYAFINSRWASGDCSMMAIAEDGEVVGGHLSSCEAWGKHDIGASSEQVAQRRYGEMYPDGFEVIYVEDDQVREHEGINAAYKLHCEKYPEGTPDYDGFKATVTVTDTANQPSVEVSDGGL